MGNIQSNELAVGFENLVIWYDPDSMFLNNMTEK